MRVVIQYPDACIAVFTNQNKPYLGLCARTSTHSRVHFKNVEITVGNVIVD